ncbi:MAG: hypothetical protein POH28_13380, partial [Acidocella sp.]|nr:hypothetical protein [Acidocella sp.]
LSVSHGHLNLSPAVARAIDAAGSFWVSQLQVQRSQALPQGLTLTANFSGQIASRNLDSSQQFYIGGPYGVMSYPVGDGGGDDGYLFTAKLSHPINLPRLPGALSGALLAQTGSVWINHTPYAGAAGKNELTESGVGVELDYAMARWTLSAAFAAQLGANSSPLVTTRRNQAWFSVSYAF